MSLLDNQLAELAFWACKCAARVDEGQDADGSQHGAGFEAVEVGFVTRDGAGRAGGEFDEAEDDADL